MHSLHALPIFYLSALHRAQTTSSSIRTTIWNAKQLKSCNQRAHCVWCDGAPARQWRSSIRTPWQLPTHKSPSSISFIAQCACERFGIVCLNSTDYCAYSFNMCVLWVLSIGNGTYTDLYIYIVYSFIHSVHFSIFGHTRTASVFFFFSSAYDVVDDDGWPARIPYSNHFLSLHELIEMHKCRSNEPNVYTFAPPVVLCRLVFSRKMGLHYCYY